MESLMKNANEETPSFNLIDEPWILARDKKGTTRKYSLMEIFERAVDLECLCNDLPTQDFAILRVLLAILQRAISPMLYEEDDPAEIWEKLWDLPELPLSAVSDYLKKWHYRFNLLDSKYPFLQVAQLERMTDLDGESPLSRVIADVPNRNIKRLFLMRNDDNINRISFDEAARWLIHVQAFDTGGPKSAAVGDLTAKKGKTSPGGTSWGGQIGCLFLEGKNLKETLLLNFVPTNGNDFEQLFSDDDLPVWEQAPRIVEDGHTSRSFSRGRADLFTWQSRWVKYAIAKQQIVDVVLTAGDKLPDKNSLHAIETMTTWKLGNDKYPSYFPHLHNFEKRFWQGLSSILASNVGLSESKNKCMPSGIIKWFRYIYDHKNKLHNSIQHHVFVHAIGFKYADSQSASYIDLIDDKVSLNPYLFSKKGQELVDLTCDCIEKTNRAMQALGKLAVKIYLASGGSNTDSGRKKQLQIKNSLEAETSFQLDLEFRVWISNLNENTNPPSARDKWYLIAKKVIYESAYITIRHANPKALVGSLVEINSKINSKKKQEQVWLTAASAWSSFNNKLGDIFK